MVSFETVADNWIENSISRVFPWIGGCLELSPTVQLLEAGARGFKPRSATTNKCSKKLRSWRNGAEAVIAEVKQRTRGHPARLLASDGQPAYNEAIPHVYGTEVTITPTDRDSKPMVPEKDPLAKLTCAGVEKRRLIRAVEM